MKPKSNTKIKIKTKPVKREGTVIPQIKQPIYGGSIFNMYKNKNSGRGTYGSKISDIFLF